MTTVTKQGAEITDKEFQATIASTPRRKANGPALAAILSAGIYAFFLGLFTSLAQAHAGFKALMDLDKNFGFKVGVGPLSGKTIYAIAIWLIAWAIAAYVMRGKEYNARPFIMATFVLIGIGLLGTFPVLYESLPILQK